MQTVSFFKHWLIFTLLVFSSTAVFASAPVFSSKHIEITHPVAPARPEGIRTGAVFFQAIRNNASVADKILSARSEVSERVELHRMVMDSGVMRMREVSEILLPPGEGPSFQQGKADAYHLMLINLKRPLKEGDQFPVWLRFQNGGELEIKVMVQKVGQASTGHHHKH